MPFIETADHTSLFYNDWGSGQPVVLVHGWPLDSDMWEYQSTFLASHGMRVVAYDRRGFGRSGQPWDGYDYDTLASDLAAVMDQLDLRGVTLAGFSMGGGEVARYLSRFGTGRVSRAALISAVTPFLLKTQDNPDGVDRGTFDGFVQGLEKDRPHFLAGFAKTFFGAGMLTSPSSSELMQWTGSMAMLGSPRATTACVRAFSETDFRPDMAAFTVPTLVLHGDADATVPLALAGQKAAQMIPGAVLKIYEGAPHALVFTEKDRLNADLLGFIQG